MSHNSAAVNVKSLSDEGYLLSPGIVFPHPHTSNVLS